jgi:hypothetical protein
MHAGEQGIARARTLRKERSDDPCHDITHPGARHARIALVLMYHLPSGSAQTLPAPFKTT